MPINESYYGPESSWVQFPVNANVEEFKKFYVASGNSMNDHTYGLAARTWISGLIANDFENKYYKPIDMSFGWCRTDGNAPVDKCLSVTGYRTSGDGARGRYTATQSGPSTMGLAMLGSVVPYIGGNVVTYYKSSKTGSTINANNAPHNYKPSGFNYRPQLAETQSGVQYVYEANTGLAPALKFDFNRVFYVPFVYYTLLKEGSTVADWEAVTNPSNYSNLAFNSYCRDLRSFMKYFTDNPSHVNRCIIHSVMIDTNVFKFNENGETEITLQDGGSVGGNRGALCAMAYPNTTTPFTFKDWYTAEEDAETFTVDLDLGFIKNVHRTPANTYIYDEHRNNVTSATFTTPSDLVVSGAVGTMYGTGYWTPVSYCYQMQCMCLGDDWTVKRFEDQSFSNTQKYAVAIYATLDDFGGLDAFREYVRKCAAYTGGIFSESYYPLWHTDLQDETCFIGTIDGNGVTHGAYTHGEANANQPQAQWGDDWGKKTPYNPSPGPGPAPDTEDPSDALNLRERAHIGAEIGPARYIVQPSDVVSLFTFIKQCTDYNNAFEGYADVRTASIPAEDLDRVKAVCLRDWQNTYPDTASWYSYVYDVMGEGVHPNNNIVGLMAFPFYARDKFSTVDAGIQLGDIDTNYSADEKFFTTKSWYQNEGEAIGSVSTQFRPHSLTAAFTAKRITGDAMCVLDLGSYQIQGRYNDYRDYKPYAHIELQVPYHGTFELDPADWVGHEVEVYAICEAVTGSSMAIVCRDGAPMFTSGGQMGTPVPLTVESFGGTTASLAANSAQFQNMQVEHRVHAVNGAIDVAKSAAKTIAAGAFTVMTAGAGAGALALAAADTTQVAGNLYGQMKTESNNIKAAEYAIEHQQTGSAVLGSAAPSVNGKYETRCRLVFHYCRLDYGANLATYGATQGYSCNRSGNVGDFSGYTVFSNVILDGIEATDAEKQMLVQELQNGVII